MFSMRTKCFIGLQVSIYLWLMTQASEPVGPQAHIRIPRTPSNLPIEMPMNKLPCPDPLEIIPCICSVTEDFEMDIDCSNVTSEDELKSVFNKDFGFKNFRRLSIENNDKLKTLREGDLGNCSFVEIHIYRCAFSYIEQFALMGSYETLDTLYLRVNQLQVFHDISHFKKIAHLDVAYNDLKEFPVLNSLTLKSLYVDKNQIKTVPVEAIHGLPALDYISISWNPISHILPGTFSNNTNLRNVNIWYTNITSLPQDAIELHGPSTYVYLNYNLITELPPGSFSGVTYWMEIKGNALHELDEEVWRPLLENNVSLFLEDNPFGCGCDIAWLVTNRTLLDRMADNATCSDGEYFRDLDPAMYEAMC